MVLVDTSVWVAHLRGQETAFALSDWLNRCEVLSHPFVVGELALGGLRQRQAVITLLQQLPVAPVAQLDEVLTFIEQAQLAGKGLGYVDAHLLAAVRLLPGARLATLDLRLQAAAQALGLAAPSAH